MTDARDALSVWDALKPKIEQLIADKTQTAVRQKKMNVSSIDTEAQTIRVYDGINGSRSITIPYVPGVGIEALSSGYSVLVQWRDNDISTAVAVAQGRGWTDSLYLLNPTLSGTVSASGAIFSHFGEILYTNTNPTNTMATDTVLVSDINVQARPYNFFFFEFAYSTDYPDTRNSACLYIPDLQTSVDMYVNGNVPWYGGTSFVSAFRQVYVTKVTSGTDRFWRMVARPGYLVTSTDHSNQTKYCIPTRIIGMHI